MKKRVLLALLMVMLLAMHAACAQTLPSNAVFSPGLIFAHFFVDIAQTFQAFIAADKGLVQLVFVHSASCCQHVDKTTIPFSIDTIGTQ